MRIHLEHNGNVFEFDRQPMEISRFAILCQLAGTTVGGVVLVRLVHMLGLWGLIWSLGGLVLVGVYRLIRRGLLD